MLFKGGGRGEKGRKKKILSVALNPNASPAHEHARTHARTQYMCLLCCSSCRFEPCLFCDSLLMAEEALHIIFVLHIVVWGWGLWEG